MTNPEINRRSFIKRSTAGVAAFSIIPSYVLSGQGNAAPSDRLNIAFVGLRRPIEEFASTENIVALCDVDDSQGTDLNDQFPKAKRYRDYRKMLEQEKSIDAVVINTPDHSHAVIAMAAMQLGKHVYCEKPMTRLLWESAKLREAAKRYNVVTQMGNQGQSDEGVRMTKEWLDAGAIGQVREVHCWTDRPIWPQGIQRPEPEPVPDHLDWDLWIGPVKKRPYSSNYHRFSWRGWWDFGTGALGDMGCHILNAPFYALELDNPVSVYASFNRPNLSPRVPGPRYNAYDKVKDETFPSSSMVHYKFAEKSHRGEIDLHWYDGGLKPKRPEAFEMRRSFPGNGALYIGDKGVLMSSGWLGGSPRLVPETAMQEFELPPKTIERIDCSHQQNWVRACKGQGKPTSDFEYASDLNEVVLLGNLAIRSEGDLVQWDRKNMKVTNIPDLNEYVNQEYRKGWSL